jgi:hypothetical protein
MRIPEGIYKKYTSKEEERRRAWRKGIDQLVMDAWNQNGDWMWLINIYLFFLLNFFAACMLLLCSVQNPFVKIKAPWGSPIFIEDQPHVPTHPTHDTRSSASLEGTATNGGPPRTKRKRSKINDLPAWHWTTIAFPQRDRKRSRQSANASYGIQND